MSELSDCCFEKAKEYVSGGGSGSITSYYNDCIANPSVYYCDNANANANSGSAGIAYPTITNILNPVTAKNNSVVGSSVYQFALSAIVLYAIMRYVPNGLTIGLIILVGVLLTTENAGSDFANFLNFIQTGHN